jgi:GNAT superfamily N-acetyltransferase
MTRPKSVRIVRVTGSSREIVAPDLLKKAEPVHRLLRPAMPADYAQRMRDIFSGGGEMCVALRGNAVVAVAVFRVFENTHVGRRFYVDDLVTDESQRSTGVGAALLRYLEEEARVRGCVRIELESGSQRSRAHKFYFRQDFVISGFSFKKDLV